MSLPLAEPRSYLYVPGDRPDMLEKALRRGADALIVDLEDAVAPVRKAEARSMVAAFLEQLVGADTRRPEIWVRINGGPQGQEDLAWVIGPLVDGICVPKVSGAPDLQALEVGLAERERETGVSVPTALQPIIETAKGVLAASEIAQCPRVRQLQLGELDLSSELGLLPGAEAHELLVIRTQLVLACAGADLPAPVGPVNSEIGDRVGFVRSCQALRRLGYRSRACIHPSQVELANEVFGIDGEELARAKRVIAEFDRRAAAGSGVMRGPGGEMIDEAVIRAARLLVARAGPDARDDALAIPRDGKEEVEDREHEGSGKE